MPFIAILLTLLIVAIDKAYYPSAIFIGILTAITILLEIKPKYSNFIKEFF